MQIPRHQPHFEYEVDPCMCCFYVSKRFETKTHQWGEEWLNQKNTSGLAWFPYTLCKFTLSWWRWKHESCVFCNTLDSVWHLHLQFWVSFTCCLLSFPGNYFLCHLWCTPVWKRGMIGLTNQGTRWNPDISGYIKAVCSTAYFRCCLKGRTSQHQHACRLGNRYVHRCAKLCLFTST